MRAIYRMALWSALVGGLAGCALPMRAVTPPPVTETASPPLLAAAQRRPNGTRVTVREGGDTFVAAVVFAAGPLNDPPNLPGLGEWMVQSALLSTGRRGPNPESPGVRALRLGGELIAVANGGVLGWAVTGPPDEAEELLKLLGDVALQPLFPATAMDLAAAHRRERQAAEGDQMVSLAIAVAIGTAVGLDRPLWMSTPVAMLSRVTREDVSRHWKRIARPDSAAVVVRGATAGEVSPLLERLDRWRPSPLRSVDPPVCSPQGLATHLVKNRSAAPERTLALFAARAPGRDHLSRPYVEARLAQVGEEPNGPLERALGSAQARRTRPDLIDLGRVGGRGVSVLIGGSVGEPELAVGDAARAVEVISGQGMGLALPEAAWRARGTRDAMERSEPLGASISEAMDLLYPRGQGSPSERHEGMLHPGGPGPWAYTYVVIGGGAQRDAISALAEPSTWSARGVRSASPSPVRCLQADAPGG